MRKSELRSALAFSDGDAAVDELVPSYIFDLCAPLIEERRDKSLSFIHVSVKELVNQALPATCLILLAVTSRINRVSSSSERLKWLQIRVSLV
jgi:hypothetical protein